MVIKKFKIKIFADGADINSIKDLNSNSLISGFTTNPTLMKKAGVTNYKKFALEALKVVKNKPISFEVFSDEIKEMEMQAKDIASWGKNIFVKIPITNSKNEKTFELVKRLSKDSIKCNITALFTLEQVKEIYEAVDSNTETIISIFAGRIADSGIDPINTMEQAIKICEKKKNIQILWASTREVFNIIQAETIGCHIITVPHPILQKASNIGKNLNELSLDTVKSFLSDAQKAGFKI